MLEKIKSIYLVKIIFSLIDEQRKLELVKYSKNIQNKLDINIMNYRIFSGIDLIEEIMEKGKNIIVLGI